MADGRSVVVGLGVTGRAVLDALVRRGHDVAAADDAGSPEATAAADRLGVDLAVGPAPGDWAALVEGAAEVLPAPGLPDHHPVFAAAVRAGVPVRSELDLAARWDDRPVVAVTGTDGKTTVTELTTRILVASGVAAVACGNNDMPLVTAVDDPATEVFVVEASSFRLLHSERFAPRAAAWLNLAPDHLDNHRSLDDYEAAKARIWAWQGPGDTAIGSADDAVVARHLRSAPAGRREMFSAVPGAGTEWRVAGGSLVGPDGRALVAVDDLPRRFGHDLANALAAAALAAPVGATPAGTAAALRAFSGLPHRLALVADAGGVRWFDSSKATTPHAAVNDVGAVAAPVVLLAGGRNKGLDLGALAAAAPGLRAVVAIGEAAPEVAAAFDGRRPVVVAESMAAAVAAAATLARPGDAVVLAPGCASFDWYRSYGERGDDFAAEVHHLLGLTRQPAAGSCPGGADRAAGSPVGPGERPT